MVYGRYNELVNGGYKPTNITGGHHPVQMVYKHRGFFRACSTLHLQMNPAVSPEACTEPLMHCGCSCCRIGLPRWSNAGSYWRTQASKAWELKIWITMLPFDNIYRIFDSWHCQPRFETFFFQKHSFESYFGGWCAELESRHLTKQCRSVNVSHCLLKGPVAGSLCTLACLVVPLVLLSLWL